MLQETLRKLKNHTFELKGFAMSWDLTEDFELHIFYKSIQTLKIQHSENMEKTELAAEIQLIFDDYCTICVINAQFGRLENVLPQGRRIYLTCKNRSWLNEMIQGLKGEELCREDCEIRVCLQCKMGYCGYLL